MLGYRKKKKRALKYLRVVVLLHLALRVLVEVAAQEATGVGLVSRELNPLGPAVPAGVVALDSRAGGAANKGPGGRDPPRAAEKARPGGLLETRFGGVLQLGRVIPLGHLSHALGKDLGDQRVLDDVGGGAGAIRQFRVHLAEIGPKKVLLRFIC